MFVKISTGKDNTRTWDSMEDRENLGLILFAGPSRETSGVINNLPDLRRGRGVGDGGQWYTFSPGHV